MSSENHPENMRDLIAAFRESNDKWAKAHEKQGDALIAALECLKTTKSEMPRLISAEDRPNAASSSKAIKSESSPPKKTNKRKLPSMDGTPIYEPMTFSPRTVELINEHVDEYNEGRLEKNQTPPFDPENTDIVVLPINPERTVFHLFALTNPKEPASEENCKPIYVGFHIRCYVDDEHGVDHSTAGAIARMHATHSARDDYFQEQFDKDEMCTNGCKVSKKEKVIHTPINGVVKVKKEPSEPAASAHPPAKKSKQSKYSDAFSKKGSEKDRKWVLWGTAHEKGGDGKATGKELYFLFERVENDLHFAVAPSNATWKPPAYFPESDIRSAGLIKSYTNMEGEEVTKSLKIFMFKGSLVPKISSKFVYAGEGLLYNEHISENIFKSLQ